MTNRYDQAFPSEGTIVAMQKQIHEDPELRDRVVALSYRNPGLTKREYFAAMVLSALDLGLSKPSEGAEWAVAYADALIKELSK